MNSGVGFFGNTTPLAVIIMMMTRDPAEVENSNGYKINWVVIKFF